MIFKEIFDSSKILIVLYNFRVQRRHLLTLVYTLSILRVLFGVRQ